MPIRKRALTCGKRALPLAAGSRPRGAAPGSRWDRGACADEIAPEPWVWLDELREEACVPPRHVGMPPSRLGQRLGHESAQGGARVRSGPGRGCATWPTRPLPRRHPRRDAAPPTPTPTACPRTAPARWAGRRWSPRGARPGRGSPRGLPAGSRETATAALGSRARTRARYGSAGRRCRDGRRGSTSPPGRASCCR